MRRAALLAMFVLAEGCAPKAVIYRSAPDVSVYFMGTAEQPWRDLELALKVAEEFGAGPFELQVFGADDIMNAPSTLNAVCQGNVCATTLGSTETNECRIFGMGCRSVIRVRELRAFVQSIDQTQPRIVRWEGPAIPIESADSSGHVAVLFDEVACRLIPARRGRAGGYTQEWLALRDSMRTRYLDLRSQ